MASITLYNTSDDRKKVNKSLSSQGSYECKWKEDTSLYKPTLKLRYSDEAVRSCNYAKWGSWYYFVTDIRLCTGGIFEVDLEIDVLMSWKSDILAITTVIDRSENSWNKYIQDEEFMGVSAQRDVYMRVIGTVGDSQSYVLAVNGGV